MNTAQAFIAFLQCEANQAEDRARSLRHTASAIESQATIRTWEGSVGQWRPMLSGVAV